MNFPFAVALKAIGYLLDKMMYDTCSNSAFITLQVDHTSLETIEVVPALEPNLVLIELIQTHSHCCYVNIFVVK